MNNRAAFGEECGNETLCAASLVCIRDSTDFYCSGPCPDDQCPEGFFCASPGQWTDGVCTRERREMEERPSFGEPCSDRGLCDAGLFCRPTRSIPMWQQEARFRIARRHVQMDNAKAAIAV